MHTIANLVDGIFRLFAHYFDRRFELRSRLNSGLHHHHLPSEHVDPSYYFSNHRLLPKATTIDVIGYQDQANDRARQTRAQPQQPTMQ